MGSWGRRGVLISLLVTAILSTTIATWAGGQEGDTAPYDPSNPPPEPFGDFAFREPGTLPVSDALPSDGDIDHLDVAVGADGAVHAVWQEWLNGTDSIFYAKRWPGRPAFDPAQRLSNASWDSREPRVALSGNGTVHVVWKNRTGGYVGNEVFLARWFPDTGGFRVRSIWSDNDLRDISLGVASNGTVYVSCTYWGEALLAKGITRRLPYRCSTGCMVIRWDDTMDQGLETYVYGISEDHHLNPARAHLRLSPAGNPHVVVESQGYIYWVRSLDGGGTWSEPVNWYDGPVDPVGFTAEALADERIAIAFSKRPHSHLPSWPYHRCGHYLTLVVSDPAGMSSTSNLTKEDITSLNLLPAAFDIEAFADGVWLAFLGFPKEKAGRPNLDGSLTPRLYSLLLRSDGDTAGPLEVADVPGRPELDPDLAEGRLDDSVLSLGLEADGRPLVAAATPLRSDGPLRGYVWRVNHAPVFPRPLSETQGGWVLDNPVELRVEPAFDLDGDVLEYGFIIVYRWGSFNLAEHTESTYARFHLPDNGDFCWTVSMSDPWTEVGTDEDWWFRFDIAPPRADAGGPYVCDEGETVLLDGGGSSDARPLALWEWDLDGDGVYEVGSEDATYDHATRDDASSRISLRVTDGAGRTDVDHSQLVVWNLPPWARIVGPTECDVDMQVSFQVDIEDPGPDDTHQVSWLVGGMDAGGGLVLAHVFERSRTYRVDAVVTDDDGGVFVANLSVEVHWVDPPEVSLFVPGEVMQGEWFRVYVERQDLNPFTTWDLEWTVDGEPLGVGPDALCRIEEPGEHTIGFSAESAEGERLVEERKVTVREWLVPVVVLGVTRLDDDHFVLEWTRCEQDHLFKRYELVYSEEPLPPLNMSYPQHWEPPPPDAAVWVSIEDIDATAYNVSGLQANTTYHACVMVIGGHQSMPSGVYSVRTLAEAPPTPGPQPQPTNGNGGGGTGDGDLQVSPAQLAGLVLVVAALTLAMAYAYVRNRG